MNELLIALLGGGTIAQLAATVLTLRQNRRQMNAAALGAEVDALEKSIRVLYDNYERSEQAHQRERDRLTARVEAAENECRRLREKVDRLEQTVRALRRLLPPHTKSRPEGLPQCC